MERFNEFIEKIISIIGGSLSDEIIDNDVRYSVISVNSIIKNESIAMVSNVIDEFSDIINYELVQLDVDNTPTQVSGERLVKNIYIPIPEST